MKITNLADFISLCDEIFSQDESSKFLLRYLHCFFEGSEEDLDMELASNLIQEAEKANVLLIEKMDSIERCIEVTQQLIDENYTYREVQALSLRMEEDRQTVYTLYMTITNYLNWVSYRGWITNGRIVG